MADFAHLQDVMGGIQGATGLPTPVTWDGKGLDPNTLMPVREVLEPVHAHLHCLRLVCLPRPVRVLWDGASSPS